MRSRPVISKMRVMFSSLQTMSRDPFCGPHSLGAADQHTKSGGVDERHADEIDDDALGAVFDAAHQGLLEFGSRIDVDFAGKDDDRDVVGGAHELDAELRTVFHAHPFAFEARCLIG